MDVKRLDIVRKHKSLLPVVLVVAIVGVVIFAAWWLSPYYDDVYAIIPGIYDSNEYNRLKEEKNDLIDENVELLAQVDELEKELEDVPLTEDGYAEVAEIHGEIIGVQTEIYENLVKIVEIGEELLSMSLPEVVEQYISLSLESDQIRVTLIELALSISEARRDQAELNGMRAAFDNCLADVNWADNDENISNQIKACSGKIVPLQEKGVDMAEMYDVELDRLTTYLTLLKEQWDANAAYYLAIHQGDYTKANEHDQVFVERKRQISELSVSEAFGEFYEEAIGVMVEDFGKMKENEVSKDEEVDAWYEQNISR